ncbi:hypothetical protein PS3A_46260 [Pseudomonas sp. 3A(2025)]
MHKTDVVVTGYGLVAPGVLDARGLFALLGAQGSCTREHSGPIEAEQWQVIHDALPAPTNDQSRRNTLIRYVAGQALAQAGLNMDEYVSTHSAPSATSTLAIGNAYRAIANGEIDLALCGGIEQLPGEGAALMVLESASHARRRGARALGRVLGFAAGTHYAQCMQAALDDARLGAHQICHVNLHGPGDPNEVRAVKQLFGANLHEMTFTANPLTAGSGVIETVLSLMSLQLGVLLPTRNHTPEKAGLNFPLSLVQQPVEAMLSNWFGVEGVNGSLILGRA